MDVTDGKVAVVTGAASGIGLAMAKRFAAAGMRVVLADVEAAALDVAVGELVTSGADAVAVPCDVASREQVDALAQRTLDAFGTAHVVCNNAGVGAGGLFADVSLEDWEWVLGVNLWGVIHGIRAFLPVLTAQDEGHIVNTASVAGLFAAPFLGPYSASKFAVVAISETLHHELAMTGSNVGVSVLCPSWVRTRIHESGRNRPSATGDAAAPPEGAPQAPDPAAGAIAGFIEQGMDPAEVADLVAAAIVERQLYILTHGGTGDLVTARARAIAAGEAPPLQMPQ